MPAPNLEETLKEHLKDLYNAEQQLVAALPGMARGAQAPGLRRAFEAHLVVTEGHVWRLEFALELIGTPAGARTCMGMEGLIDEGKEILAGRLHGKGASVDAALIAAARRVAHYEIGAYGSAKEFAELLDMSDVTDLLQWTLEDENHANDTLIAIARHTIHPAAMQNEYDEGDEGAGALPASG